MEDVADGLLLDQSLQRVMEIIQVSLQSVSLSDFLYCYSQHYGYLLSLFY